MESQPPPLITANPTFACSRYTSTVNVDSVRCTGR